MAACRPSARLLFVDLSASLCWHCGTAGICHNTRAQATSTSVRMADPAPTDHEDTSAALLDELTQQLAEQRASLADITAALALHPSECSLLDIKAELEDAISHMEQALSELQDGNKQQMSEVPLIVEEQWSEGVADEQQQAQPSTSTFSAGDACRFRYMDGRWYRGVVIAVYDHTADVNFAVPTKPFMLQPVVGMPLAVVEPRTTTTTTVSWTVGARLLAKAPWSRLWAAAELTALDASTGSVVFPQGGRAAQLAFTELAASPYDEEETEAVNSNAWDFGRGASLLGDAAGSDEQERFDSDDGSSVSGDSGGSELDSEQEEELDSSSGVARLALGLRSAGAMEHARLAAEAGVQSSTVLFAHWESHTRGIASKLLAGMGFVQGQGLGRSGGGQVAPLEVTLLPLRRGLGGSNTKTDGAAAGDGTRKKRRRGGERARRKKHKAETAAAKQAQCSSQNQREVETGDVGLFALINSQLGDGGEAAQKLEEAGFGNGRGSLFASSSGAADNRRGAGAAQAASKAPPDRRGLLQQQHKVAAAQEKVHKLAAMLARNKGNRPLAIQISQKLALANADVDRARSELASMSSAVTKGEAKKGMFKF